MKIKPEEILQIQCVSYFKFQYPKKMIFHVPNSWIPLKKGPSFAYFNKLKQMGYMVGMIDLIVPEPIMDVLGLCIELKVLPNKPTLDQLRVLEEFEARKWKCAVIYTFEDFKFLVNSYFEKEKK